MNCRTTFWPDTTFVSVKDWFASTTVKTFDAESFTVAPDEVGAVAPPIATIEPEIVELPSGCVGFVMSGDRSHPAAAVSVISALRKEGGKSAIGAKRGGASAHLREERGVCVQAQTTTRAGRARSLGRGVPSLPPRASQVRHQPDLRGQSLRSDRCCYLHHHGRVVWNVKSPGFTCHSGP